MVRPSSPGIADGKLFPCPGRPNCVSSHSADQKHYIEPLHYRGTLTQAREGLVSVLRSMPRSKLVTVKEDYIHAEFTSKVFRFVDDAEFYFDDTRKTIHLRSASRIGYSDLGVNRNRMERIRASLQKCINEKERNPNVAKVEDVADPSRHG